MPIPTMVDPIVQSNKGRDFKPTLVPGFPTLICFPVHKGNLTAAVSSGFTEVGDGKLVVFEPLLISSLDTRPDRWGSWSSSPGRAVKAELLTSAHENLDRRSWWVEGNLLMSITDVQGGVRSRLLLCSLMGTDWANSWSLVSEFSWGWG